MYTTPLSTLVSSLSLNHHLYADDTQLFLSFHPSDFHSNISHLQNALQQISSWMTANLLTLNSSKTEFLLIGLKGTLRRTHSSAVGITWHCPHMHQLLFSSLSVSALLLSRSFSSALLRYDDLSTVSCIMWQSSLAACGHVGVATRASGVLFMTRRDMCVRACSGSCQSNVINRRRRTCLNLSV